MSKKTALEHFQDIKEVEVAVEIRVEDLLPYKCEQVEKSLKALEIIKEKNVNMFWLKECFNLEQYNYNMADYMKLTEEEFRILKEVLK